MRLWCQRKPISSVARMIIATLFWAEATKHMWKIAPAFIHKLKCYSVPSTRHIDAVPWSNWWDLFYDLRKKIVDLISLNWFLFCRANTLKNARSKNHSDTINQKMTADKPVPIWFNLVQLTNEQISNDTRKVY